MSGQNDLTQGNITSMLLRYAGPFVVSNFLQATYNIADMIIAGHYGGSSYAQSAIGNSSTVINLLTQVIIGITIGGGVLIGQYYGAKQKKECQETTGSLFTMGLLIGLGVAIVLFLMANQIMIWMDAPALEQSQQYLRICAVGMFFVTVYNAACAALRAVGDSKRPFICVAVSVVLNIILDLVFMAGLNMGVAGAAWATVISQIVSAILSVFYLWREKELFGLCIQALKLQGDKVKGVFKVGLPCAVQMSVVSIAWIVVTTLVNSYDVNVSAASSVTMKISQLAQLFSAAMYSAVSGIVAQCAGAKDYDRIRKVVHRAIAITLSVTVVLVVIVELTALYDLPRLGRGRGQHLVRLFQQLLQLYPGPAHPGRHLQPLLRPHGSVLGLHDRPLRLRPSGVLVRTVQPLDAFHRKGLRENRGKLCKITKGNPLILQARAVIMGVKSE